MFVDLTLAVARTASLTEAHDIAARAEEAVRSLAPHTDVMVHIDPAAQDDRSLVELVRSVAGEHGLAVHNLRIHDVRGHLTLEMHAEVPENLTVSGAHDRISALEDTLARRSPLLRDIVVHIEPVGDAEARHRAVATTSADLVEAIRQVSKALPAIRDCHSISTLDEGGKASISFHCTLASDLPITRAHELTEQFENMLRARLPELGRVAIHVEPAEELKTGGAPGGS
jgi:divalent metal cation (Fe/Co/Zn/Cd) transporter